MKERSSFRSLSGSERLFGRTLVKCLFAAQHVSQTHLSILENMSSSFLALNPAESEIIEPNKKCYEAMKGVVEV